MISEENLKKLSIQTQNPRGEIQDEVNPCIDLVLFIRKPFKEWIAFYNQVYEVFLNEFHDQFTHCDYGTGKSIKATKHQLNKSLKWIEDEKKYNDALISYQTHSGTGIHSYWSPKAPAFEFFQEQATKKRSEAHVRFSFPIEYDPKKIIVFVKKYFNNLPLHSGYAGYSLLCDSSNAYNKSWSKRFVELLNQYPGLNYPDAMRVGGWAEDRIAVVSWLTFLSDDLIKKMGGLEKMKKDLGKEFIFHSLGSSVCIQAGEKPALGKKAADSLPLYKKLGHYLNPLRANNKTMAGMGVAGKAQSDEDDLKWYLRFFK